VFRSNLRATVLWYASICLTAVTSQAQTQPTITGVNAFWYLGGVLSDGPGCGRGGWCYYAQASWTANANGHAGTPTWTVENNPVGGVTLSCYTCSATQATSTTASAGCNHDVAVYVTHPDGAQSAPFYVLINTPASTTLQANYPQNSTWIKQPGFNGYASTYQWSLFDLCGNGLQGLDVNETFGSWTVDYPGGTDWPYPPTADSGYQPSFNFPDTIGASTPPSSNPPAENPQSPLGTTAVIHDYPWNYFVGSTTFGVGVVIHSDTQQWYQDHGTHSAANW
jgi:hypothetical protein